MCGLASFDDEAAEESGGLVGARRCVEDGKAEAGAREVVDNGDDMPYERPFLRQRMRWPWNPEPHERDFSQIHIPDVVRTVGGDYADRFFDTFDLQFGRWLLDRLLEFTLDSRRDVESGPRPNLCELDLAQGRAEPFEPLRGERNELRKGVDRFRGFAAASKRCVSPASSCACQMRMVSSETSKRRAHAATVEPCAARTSRIASRSSGPQRPPMCRDSGKPRGLDPVDLLEDGDFGF